MLPPRAAPPLGRWLASPRLWLCGIALILLVRFPLKFAREPSTFLMDLAVFRAVGERVLHGRPDTLYERVETDKMVFKYAPGWTLALAPLGRLTDHAAAVVWSSLTVVWCVLSLWLGMQICRSLGYASPPPLAAAAVLLLVRPITAEFLLGQTNLLWGALVTAFLYLDLTRRPWPAALGLSLAISLKVPALLFILYLLLRGRWATVLRTAAWLLGLNLLAAWWLLPAKPIQLFLDWVRVLAATGPDRAFEIGNQSLLALAGRLLRPDGYALNILSLPDRAVVLVAGALAVALFAAVVFPRRMRLPEPLRLAIDGALLSVLMVVCSPTCWIATYNALLFPLVLALTLAAGHPRSTLRLGPRPPSTSLGAGRPGASLRMSPPPSRRGVLSLSKDDGVEPRACPGGSTLRRRPWLTGMALVALLSLLTHSKVWRALGLRYFRGESYVFLVLMILPLLGLSLVWLLWHQRRDLAGHTVVDA